MGTGDFESIGWVSLVEANDYLLDDLRYSTWAALADIDKRRYLMAGYRLIANNPAYTLPTPATQKLKDAQVEQAIYMLASPDGRRVDELRAAGVKSFSIGNFSQSFGSNAESILSALGSSVTLSPIVIDLLSEYIAPESTPFISRPYDAIF